jgi:hypothetical protein
VKLAAPGAELPQIVLEQGMRVDADSVAVDEAMDRVIIQERAKLLNAARVQAIEVSELANFAFQCIERLALVLASMDEDGHSMSEWNFSESGRRVFEEGATGERQCPDQPVAERIVEHGRASPRRVVADLRLGLEDHYTGMV